MGSRWLPPLFMPVHLSLGSVQVTLTAHGTAIKEGWDALFGTGPAAQHRAQGTLTLHLQQATQLPALPSSPPIFVDEEGIVDIYTSRPERFVLHFHDGALVTLDPAAGNAEGVVTGAALASERLEDVTYTSLAPLLRRHDHYLLHAFAATWEGAALLLVGPSGSGKTTTGLSLVLAGWGLLANDVVLLHCHGERVYAYPTPGALTVRTRTLDLLPRLRHYNGQHHLLLDSYTFTTRALRQESWAAPAPVRALCFPAVTAAADSALQLEMASVTFAHLMEESVDRWDTDALPAHLALLEKLSKQATGYRIALGADVPNLPALLAQTL